MADAKATTPEVVPADPSKTPANPTPKKSKKETAEADPRGRKVIRNGFEFWLKD